MKRNDIKELHQLKVEELNKKLAELKQQLIKAQMDLSVNKLSDPRMVSKIKDDMARIKTVIRSKELVSSKQESK